VKVGKPDRSDSEQQELQAVQEPVLVLTTSHLLLLEQGQQPVVVLPLEGAPLELAMGSTCNCEQATLPGISVHQSPWSPNGIGSMHDVLHSIKIVQTTPSAVACLAAAMH